MTTKCYWNDTAHYNLFNNSIKCSCCGNKRKRMFRSNYPKASNQKFDKQRINAPIDKSYPHNKEPYNNWKCSACWRKCPSGSCEIKNG